VSLLALLGALTWVVVAVGIQPYDTYESTVAADGPAAQYRFDDAAGSQTLSDSAGIDTAVNSGVSLGGEGPFRGGRSGSFNGEAFAALPSNPLASATAFTAEAWINWAGGSYGQRIFDFGKSVVEYMYLTPATTFEAHKTLFEIHTALGGGVQVTAPQLQANLWAYVAVTETSTGTLTIYVNGAQVGQITGATINPSSIGPTTHNWLGKAQLPTEPGFKGKLSNVAFYTRALTSAQIKAHYNAAEFPVNTALPTITGTPQDQSTLTASAGTWVGLAPISFTYQWTRCNTSGSGCANISEATNNKYAATPQDVGSTLRISVTGANSAGSSSGTSVQTSKVEALPPANTALPAISGVIKKGHLLRASTGTWTGTPPLHYAYQWQRCNSSGEACSAISGATSSTYVATASDVGSTLRIAITAANAGGATSASSLATAQVADSPCTDTWIGAGEGKWREASNWSSGNPPSTSDVACADAGTSILSDATSQASAVYDEGTLVVSEGALELGTATSTLNALTIAGGTVSGAGEIDVTGTFGGGEYGWIQGPGALVLKPGATGTINPADGSWLTVNSHGLLRNEGSLTIGRTGGITANPGAQLINTGTLTVNGEGAGENHGLLCSSCSASLINTGTVQKTEGSGASLISFAIDNEGTVSSRSGQLEFGGGGTWGGKSPGSWSASPGAAIALTAGNFSLGSTTTMSGSITLIDGTNEPIVHVGQIQGSGANLTVTGNGNSGSGSELVLEGPGVSTVHNLTVSGAYNYAYDKGTVAGPGELDVTGSFTAGHLGALTSKLTLVLESGATGTIDQKWMSLNNATLVNNGSLAIAKEAGIVGEAGGRIINHGTLAANGENWAENHGLVSSIGAASITNTGTLQKTEGSGTTVVGFAVDNESLVRAETGQLEFTGGANSGQLAADTWSAGAGASIALANFGNASYALGSTVTLTGRIVQNASVTAGTIEGAGADLTNRTGNLTLTGVTPSALNSLTLLEPPEEVGGLEQNVWITAELAVTAKITWSSNATFLRSGTIVAGTNSTTVFDPPAWVQLRGGQFVNEGTATWTSGGFQGTGTFFVNRGTFQANQNGGNPLVQSCEYVAEQLRCPTFENNGIVTAVLPTEGWHPGQILWRVDMLGYGRVKVPYRTEGECSGGPAEVETCQRANREFKGLLVGGGARVEMLPWNVSSPTITREGETVTASSGTWRVKPDPTFAYQWERCQGDAPGESIGEGCTNIEGATGPQYVLTSADSRHSLRVAVTATNWMGYETITSAPLALEAPSATPEPGEEAEQVPHRGVGNPISSGEHCRRSPGEGEHCYGIVHSPSVNAPSGFLGSAVKIDPKCFANNGDTQNFTTVEQWLNFPSEQQRKEGHRDWVEAGALIPAGSSSPEYFEAEEVVLGGNGFFFKSVSHQSTPRNQYFADTIWLLRKEPSGEGTWEAQVEQFATVTLPHPGVAKELRAGTENSANDVAAEAYLKEFKYETTTKGVWRWNWSAEHKEMMEKVEPEPPYNTAVAKVTSPTTAEVSFNSRSC
jgi:Concanavalin A-like lectin/glucanases superfamily